MRRITLICISSISLQQHNFTPCDRGMLTPKSNNPEKRAFLGIDCVILVELSGYCPPSPKSLTGAFSKLSFDFDLLGRTSQSGTYRTQQILNLVHRSNHAVVPARVYGRKAERFGPTLCVRWLT